jgi:phosphopantothenoylcysteine synthetase/decarboxylase
VPANEIIIAVTGSIAAYKSCDLVRELSKSGYSVRVMMTENAQHFVGRTTFEALSGKEVWINQWKEGMPHIDIKNHAKVFAVVPATANTIAKMASGIADDLLTSTYLALQCPVLVAPAMNPTMYLHPRTQSNLKILKDDGVHIMDPQNGIVVCGDEGQGKLASIDIIMNSILDLYNK